GQVRVTLRVGNNGEVVLQTYQVGEPPERAPGAEEVAEFRRAVKRGRVKNDVRVDVLFVNMGADYVCMVAFDEALGQLAPDAVCLFGRDLTGLERLADVVRDHARLFAAGAQRILPLREHELRRHELRRAAVGIDQRAFFGLIRVLDVIRSLGQ